MRLNYFFLIGIITLGLVACNSSDTVIPENIRTEKNVTIQISNGNMGTRSLESPVTAATVNLVKNALVIFTNGNDNTSTIVFAKPLTGSDLTQLMSSTNGNKGYTIKVPTAATHVYVVLNSTTAITNLAVVNKTIAELNAAVLQINDMNTKAEAADANSTGTITMYGKDILTADAVTAGFGPNAQAADLYANVIVSPLVARVEVTNVTPKTGSQISSFTIDGVFIKKLHQTITLGSTAGSLVDYSNITAGAGQTLNTAYYTESDGTYSGTDKNMRNLISPITFTSSNIAGFQLAAAATPIMVLKLSNIKLTGNVNYGDDATKKYYIVIRGFKSNGTSVASLTANNVYKLDLSGENGIDVNNITEDVDVIQKSVWVGVSITPWTVVNVTPTF